MCAINGFNFKDEALIERMNQVTRHRGPDGSRAWNDRDVVTLGFNRLAIIDLSPEAMQPMVDASGRYMLVFNGEIYNFRELKKELGAYPFQTEGDSEVILAAYQRWGGAAFSKLNGMFALAIWDKEDETLTLARDSGGVKPLYYYHDSKKFIFSSEIKGILESGVHRKLNREALVHYLRLMYVPAPQTMFEGIKKLQAGKVLTLKKNNISIENFRVIQNGVEVPKQYHEARDLVRKTVKDSVVRQLVSDRPVGLYLSGGIDSSIILASASVTHPAINTYSIGYDLLEDEQAEKFNADRELARETATFFGSTHHEFLLSSDDALALFKESVRHLDEPIGNATALSQLFLARHVQKTATVVLSGDGGDELFGGYERYRLAHLADLVRPFVPHVLSDVLRLSHLYAVGVDRYQQLMFQKDDVLRRVLKYEDVSTRSLFEEYFNEGDIVTELMNTDQHMWLVDEALTRGDKMSMAGSIENRVPFLDEEVKSLAKGLPRKYLVTMNETKKILRDAFHKDLPPHVIHAPKRGWFSPGAKWLRRDDFVRFADDVFSEEYAGNMAELIDISSVRRLWQDHREKKAYHYTILFALLVFLVWAHEYRVSP